ncbi:MAG: lactonase family protein, partial [Holophagales bacterium]|nr:lactonase family protein [Holophagales bacterium]
MHLDLWPRSGSLCRAPATVRTTLFAGTAIAALVLPIPSRAQLSPTLPVSDPVDWSASEVLISNLGIAVYATGRVPVVRGTSSSELEPGRFLRVYLRELETGEVFYLRGYEDGDPGFEGLRAQAADLSPDDRHLYLANSDPDAPGLDGLRIYEQNLPLRELTEVAFLPAGDGGLSDVREVLVTPDGRHVITAGRTLLVFARDSATGLLTQVQELAVGGGRRHLWATDDGLSVVSAGENPALRLFSRDPENGLLTVKQSRDEVLAGGQVLSEIHHFSGVGSRAFAAAVEPAPGDAFPAGPAYLLELGIGTESIDLEAFADLGTTSDLSVRSLAAHPVDSSVQAMIHTDTGPCRTLDTFVASGSSLTRVATPGPSSCSPGRYTGTTAGMAWSADGRHLYVPAFDRQSLALAVPGEPGQGVRLAERPTDGRDGLYQVSNVVIPGGPNAVYAVSSLSLTGLRWSWRGELARDFRQHFGEGRDLRTLLRLPGKPLDTRSSALIAAFEGEDRLHFARISETTGTLELLAEAVVPEAAELIHLDAVSSQGAAHLYVRSSLGDAHYRSDIRTLELERVSQPDLPAGRFRFSNASTHIYVERGADDSGPLGVGLLNRHPESGEIVGTVEQIPGLEAAAVIAVSPDGGHLAAVEVDAENTIRLAVFSRTAGTGGVTLVQTLDASALGPWPSELDLAFDALGDTLFAAGSEGDVVLSWNRDRSTGLLSERTATAVELGGPLRFTTELSGHGLYLADTGRNQVIPFRQDCTLDGPEQLCVGQSERFRVEVDWSDGDGNSGQGTAVPAESNDSGLLWFFGENNWEMLVKVLDGCDINGRHWVLAAATTDVGYTLTVQDDFTGERTAYTNSLGTASPAVVDVEALEGCPVGVPVIGSRRPSEGPGTVRARAAGKADEVLSLGGGRFELEVAWRTDDDDGTAKVVPVAS